MNSKFRSVHSVPILHWSEPCLFYTDLGRVPRVLQHRTQGDMTFPELRQPQRECFEALRDVYEEQADANCQLWCGVGKTLVFFYTITELEIDRAIIVVPTLDLVRQVKSDYIERYGLTGWDYICSEPGSEFCSAADYCGEGHVLTTYASLPSISLEHFFDVAIFDEAHHFKDNWDNAATSWKFSATLDTPSDELTYDYNIAMAIEDRYAQDFQIECFVRPLEQQPDLPRLLKDVSEETANNKLLVFTRFAETDERSCLAWMNEHAEGIRTLGGWVECLTAKHSPRKRAAILQEFENRQGFSVLVSCRVLAEGVDTREGDTLLFADPKTSRIQIMQNLGRVTRRKNHDRPSTVIVPIFVDPDKYSGTREEVSKTLEEDMKVDDGDFRPLLNVLAVLREEVPDWESFVTSSRKQTADCKSDSQVKTSPSRSRLTIRVEPSLSVLWSLEDVGIVRRSLVSSVSQSAPFDPESRCRDVCLEFLQWIKDHDNRLPKVAAGVVARVARKDKNGKFDKEHRLAIWFDSYKCAARFYYGHSQDYKSSRVYYPSVGALLVPVLGDLWFERARREELVLAKCREFLAWVDAHNGRVPQCKREARSVKSKVKLSQEVVREYDLARWFLLYQITARRYYGIKTTKVHVTYYPNVGNMLAQRFGSTWYISPNAEDVAVAKSQELLQWVSRYGTLPKRVTSKQGKENMKKGDLELQQQERLATWFSSYQRAAREFYANGGKRVPGLVTYYPKGGDVLKEKLGDTWYDKNDLRSEAMGRCQQIIKWVQENNNQMPKFRSKRDKDPGATLEYQCSKWLAEFRRATVKHYYPGTVKTHKPYYSEVDKAFSRTWGKEWYTLRKRKRNSLQVTTPDKVINLSGSTRRLVKRSRLDKSRFLSMSREELLEYITKHQVQDQRVTGSFPADARDTDVDKVKCNDMFAKAAATSTGLVVFLDSPAMYSTKRLLEEGVPIERMVVPQLDKEEYQKMSEWPHVRPGSMQSVIAALDPESVGVIWADYCCTWKGNENVRPKEDLELMVQRNLVKDAIFLTTTMQHVSRSQSIADLHDVREILGDWESQQPIVYGSDMLFQSFVKRG